jgi:hypothetical protein
MAEILVRSSLDVEISDSKGPRWETYRIFKTDQWNVFCQLLNESDISEKSVSVGMPPIENYICVSRKRFLDSLTTIHDQQIIDAFRILHQGDYWSSFKDIFELFESDFSITVQRFIELDTKLSVWYQALNDIQCRVSKKNTAAYKLDPEGYPDFDSQIDDILTETIYIDEIIDRYRGVDRWLLRPDDVAGGRIQALKVLPLAERVEILELMEKHGPTFISRMAEIERQEDLILKT